MTLIVEHQISFAKYLDTSKLIVNQSLGNKCYGSIYITQNLMQLHFRYNTFLYVAKMTCKNVITLIR